MPTVRYVDPVNGPYYTIQEAHDAASAGDTLVLAPGDHGSAVLTKAVHLKGDTTDPEGVPCRVVESAGAYSIRYDLPTDTAGDIWVEGVWFQQPGSFDHGLGLMGPGELLGRLRTNRCIWSGSTTQRPVRLHYITNQKPYRWRCENCRFDRSDLNRLALVSNDLSSEVELLRCQTYAAPVLYNITASDLALWIDDTVRVPTAGYGPAYGAFYFDQWADGAIQRIAGTVELGGDSLVGDSQVFLYRERADRPGHLERIPWMETTPDPISGAWEFRYLPTDHRYAVLVNPPEDYEPRIRRWYSAAQG